jgi:hypothetical protein
MLGSGDERIASTYCPGRVREPRRQRRQLPPRLRAEDGSPERAPRPNAQDLAAEARKALMPETRERGALACPPRALSLAWRVAREDERACEAKHPSDQVMAPCPQRVRWRRSVDCAHDEGSASETGGGSGGVSPGRAAQAQAVCSWRWVVCFLNKVGPPQP